MNTHRISTSQEKAGLWALLTAGLAALFASACCLGPLVLITLGISGAWISQMSQLGPMQPVFLVAAVVALVLAWRRIWRPAAVCLPGQVCARPAVKHAYKLLFASVVALLTISLAFPFIAH